MATTEHILIYLFIHVSKTSKFFLGSVYIYSIIVEVDQNLFPFSLSTKESCYFQDSSTTNLERPAARRLPLLGALLRFGPRATQHLQEVGGAPAHAAVDVGFAGLDVVVEVVAEGLDVGDDFFAARWGQVAGEEDCEGKYVSEALWYERDETFLYRM